MSTPDSHKLWSHKKPQPYKISYETVNWVSSSEFRFSIIKRFLDNRDYTYVISSVCSFFMLLYFIKIRCNHFVVAESLIWFEPFCNHWLPASFDILIWTCIGSKIVNWKNKFQFKIPKSKHFKIHFEKSKIKRLVKRKRRRNYQSLK